MILKFSRSSLDFLLLNRDFKFQVPNSHSLSGPLDEIWLRSAALPSLRERERESLWKQCPYPEDSSLARSAGPGTPNLSILSDIGNAGAVFIRVAEIITLAHPRSLKRLARALLVFIFVLECIVSCFKSITCTGILHTVAVPPQSIPLVLSFSRTRACSV